MVAPQQSGPRRSLDAGVTTGRTTFKFFVLASHDFEQSALASEIRQLASRKSQQRDDNDWPVSRHWSLQNIKRIFSFANNKEYKNIPRCSSCVASIASDSRTSKADNENECRFKFRGNSYSFTFYNVEDLCSIDNEKLNLELDQWLEHDEHCQRFILNIVPLSAIKEESTREAIISNFQHLLTHAGIKESTFVLFFMDCDGKSLKRNGEKSELQRRERVSKSDPNYSKFQNKKLLAQKFHDAMADTEKRDEPLYCRFTNSSDKGCMKAINDIIKMNLLNSLLEKSTMLSI